MSTTLSAIFVWMLSFACIALLIFFTRLVGGGWAGDFEELGSLVLVLAFLTIAAKCEPWFRRWIE